MIPEIVFATGGGLIGGTIYSLVGHDTALTILCVIAGAIALMLLHDLFELAPRSMTFPMGRKGTALRFARQP
jgi:hypothetical protein